MPWRDRCGRCQDCMTNDGSRSTCTSSSTTRLWRERLVFLERLLCVAECCGKNFMRISNGCIYESGELQLQLVSCGWEWWLAGATRESVATATEVAGATRVPGLPIRNFAGISNNLAPRGAKVSEHRHSLSVCIWFRDWAHLSPESTVRVLPHPHRSPNNYFSIFVQFSSPNGPSFFLSVRFTK